MAKCPKCGRESIKPMKKWKYGHFSVEMFICICGTTFKEYAIGGKYRFTLKHEKGERWVKV